jgi:excisionase family DNA binding protein
MSTEKLAYRVSEAAALISVSRYRLYDAIRDGEIPYIRLTPNGDMRIAAADLHAWLERSRVSNAQAVSP